MLSEIFFGKCPACSGFSKLNEPLCDECYNNVIKAGHICLTCGYPISKEGAYCPKCAGKIKFYGDKVYTAFKYDGAIRQLILNIKFHYNIRSAIFLPKVLNFDLGFDINSYDIITYVPSHFLRNFRRFKHPAKIISDYFNKIAQKNHIKVLKRSKRTVFQYELNSEDRKENVKNAFNICYNINMLNILLVDDIFTTGSTLNECARLLKYFGASKVDCFVLAID